MKGSNTWYKEMASKLSHATYELRLEKAKALNKLPAEWSLVQVKEWIIKARNTIKLRMQDSLSQYPLTEKDMLPVWMKRPPEAAIKEHPKEKEKILQMLKDNFKP